MKIIAKTNFYARYSRERERRRRGKKKGMLLRKLSHRAITRKKNISKIASGGIGSLTVFLGLPAFVGLGVERTTSYATIMRQIV